MATKRLSKKLPATVRARAIRVGQLAKAQCLEAGVVLVRVVAFG